MLAKAILSLAVAATVTVVAPGAIHAQESPAPATPYVYRVGVKGLTAPPPACVAGVVQETQTASCPAGQTVGGAVDGLSTFTQAYQVTTACPSGEYGAPVATPSEASPTVAATCSEPDPWAAFFKGLGVAVPNPWSAGFRLDNGVSALPAAPYPASSISGDIFIYGQRALTNVNGLSSLQSVTGSLTLGMNGLTNVNGLSSLKSVGLMNLQGNKLTGIDGLSSLQNVVGSLTLTANQLSNVDGLSSLQSVGDVLELRNNNLTNVNGLSNLQHLGFALWLNNNPELVDLSGLSGLQTALRSGGGAYFDAGIQLRIGFVPIQGGALCAQANAAKFKAGYATQAQVCASVH